MRELYALRCFVIIAEELHMTRAAQRLQIAQPNLTRIIRSLEEEVECALFDHSNKRHLALTPAGHAFLQEVVSLLAQYDHAVQVAQQISRGEPHKLVVGYTAAAIFSVLPTILQAFQHRCQAEVTMHDVSTTGRVPLIRALREGRLDVAFVLGSDDVAGIAHEWVCQAPLRVVLPVSHPLARLETISLTDLSKEPWVWLPRHIYPRLYDEVIALCQQAGFHPRIEHIVPQAQAIVSLVAAHTGISVVTQWTEQCLPQQGVVYRELSDVIYQAELQVLWRVQEASPFVDTFLQVVRAVREEAAPQEETGLPNRTGG